jgi:hypothetical protein
VPALTSSSVVGRRRHRRLGAEPGPTCHCNAKRMYAVPHRRRRHSPCNSAPFKTRQSSRRREIRRCAL